MKDDQIRCGKEVVNILWEGLSDFDPTDGFYYCSKCGKALDDHK